jgi:hypothetical protein
MFTCNFNESPITTTCEGFGRGNICCARKAKVPKKKRKINSVIAFPRVVIAFPRAVIASVAKQSLTINAFFWDRDCFVATLLAMTASVEEALLVTDCFVAALLAMTALLSEL